MTLRSQKFAMTDGPSLGPAPSLGRPPPAGFCHTYMYSYNSDFYFFIFNPFHEKVLPEWQGTFSKIKLLISIYSYNPDSYQLFFKKTKHSMRNQSIT